MPDSYQLTAMFLTVLLLPAFTQLYFRFRNTRTLLWLFGFLFACVRMLQYYKLGLWDFTDPAIHPWIVACGETAILISSALFLASLSPLGFRIGRVRILYVVPFTIPLIAYAFLIDGVFHGLTPGGSAFLLFPALLALSLFAACAWAISHRDIPRVFPLILCVTLGGTALRICFRVGGGWPLVFVESAIHLTTALLVFYVFRRISAGTMLAALGFLGWSLNIGETLPFLHIAVTGTIAAHIIVMSKVVAAMGMILIALEDQLLANEAAQNRERHAREEMEAYARLNLARRRIEDFDRQGSLICQSIVSNSRFSQAAASARPLSSCCRIRGTTASQALPDSMTPPSPPSKHSPRAFRLQAFSIRPASPPLSNTARPSISISPPFLVPGDDLTRLKVTTVQAIPLRGRSSTEGAIFLSGLANPLEPVSAVDLLPLEVLATRLQSVRSQTMMLEKLVEAEKFVGIGQLAGNVTRQLNNPAHGDPGLCLSARTRPRT